jgi:hypothetical protein
MQAAMRVKFPGTQLLNPGNQLIDKVRMETFPGGKGYARKWRCAGSVPKRLIFSLKAGRQTSGRSVR